MKICHVFSKLNLHRQLGQPLATLPPTPVSHTNNFICGELILRGARNVLGTALCSEWISRKSLFLSARVPCIWHKGGFDGVSCSSLHTGSGRGIQVRGTRLKSIVFPVRGCAGEPSWGLSLLSSQHNDLGLARQLHIDLILVAKTSSTLACLPLAYITRPISESWGLARLTVLGKKKKKNSK